jgi:hypothetical protein
MKKSLNTIVVSGLVAIALVAFADGSVSVLALQGKPIPRTSWDKKPDFTGVWRGTKLDGRAYGLVELDKLYRPDARAKMKALTAQDDPIRHCMPYGYPRVLATAMPFQIVQSVGVMIVLNSHPHLYRHIPIDGRSHTEDIFPSYQGDSVGRWEGDTLVVDVTAMNGKIWLAGAEDRPTSGGAGGWITSEELHIVERWRMVDADTLEYQAVVEDAQVLTGRWTTPRIVLKRAPIRTIDEGHCIPEGLDWQSPAIR